MCVKSNPGKDILFVDQDMTFTEEDIKAVAHGDITGGKYNSRDGTPCYEEDWIGAGFLFVSGEVFERVPFPWFDSGWRSETEFESEDQYFCRKAIKAGFEINQVQCPTLKHHITEEGTMQQSQDGNRSTTINPEAIAGQCISECTNSIGEMKKVLIFLIQTIKRLQDENNELKVRNQNLEKTKTTTPKTKKM